jgi:hypothetical protein
MELVSIMVDNAADARGRGWLARGAEADRRTAKRIRGLLILIGGALVIAAVIALS